MNHWLAQVYINNDDQSGFPFCAAAKHKITGRIELELVYSSVHHAAVNARGLASMLNRDDRSGHGQGDLVNGFLCAEEEFSEKTGWQRIRTTKGQE